MERFSLKCRVCKSRTLTESSYCTMTCMRCGLEHPGFLTGPSIVTASYRVPLVPACNYTRHKRFRKYLQRAGMNQSASSIPEETWRYLIEHRRHYQGPCDIIATLKRAGSKIKKKCYDSLPLLVNELCPHLKVPTLSENDKYKAHNAFRQLDEAFETGEPFVSYLYALEFILVHIGRADMLPYINKIQCRKRRAAYAQRLRRIFNSTPSRSIACSLASSSSR